MAGFLCLARRRCVGDRALTARTGMSPPAGDPAFGPRLVCPETIAYGRGADLMSRFSQSYPAPAWQLQGGCMERREITIPRLIKTPGAVLIARAAIDKGLSVEAIARNLFIVSGNGRTEVFNLSMASSNSHIAETICWDKHLTSVFLKRGGVPTPDGLSFRSAQADKAARFMARSRAKAFVLKPVDGVHGKMVFMDIDSRDKLFQKLALIPPRFDQLLIEEQVSGVEARYFVVADKVVAVAERRPANVVGDGVTSIAALISQKTASREGHLALKGITLDDDAMELLHEQGLAPESIPEPGVRVILKRVSNISQGGDSVDITDQVHPGMKALAVTALNAIPGLIYGGLDIIAQDHSAPPDGQRTVVLEINWHSMIRMHHAPAIGTPRDVAGAIVDHLFALGAGGTGQPAGRV